MITFKNHLLATTFLVIYFLLLSYKLISHPTPFFDWDESINVQVSKEMVENKSLVPLWQGNVWLDKPPFPFLFFGLIMKLIPFIQPEISLRIATLLLALIALTFIYAVTYKSTRDKLMAFLTVLVTSFTPIFLQRSQIVNLDVFLIIGWLGYLIFVQNFWLSFIFLAISVMTKSLIGFYPIPILFIYYFFFNKDLKIIKQLFTHSLLLFLWYLLMFFRFGDEFWQQHILETHFMRVTASIESHFGQRTYYIDLMREQLQWLFGFSVIGLSVLIWRFFRRQLTTDKLMFFLFLMPWFIFLNLTKTKIFWYLYPAIPQFALLAVYPLTLLNKKKIILYLASTILIALVFYNNFITSNLFTTFYSKPEDYYHLALYAKDKCDSLSVLVSKETREANKTLDGLGLTITSTTQWGDHPSIVYYSGKRVNFIYDSDSISMTRTDCLAIRKDDTEHSIPGTQFRLLKNFDHYSLFKQ